MKLFILHCPVYHQMNVVVPVLSLFFTWMDQVPFIDVYQAGFSLYYSKTIRKKKHKRIILLLNYLSLCVCCFSILKNSGRLSDSTKPTG